MKNAQISLETAKEMLTSGVPSLKKLAMETYPELSRPTTFKEVLTKLGLPDQWYHPAHKIELIVEAIQGKVVFDWSDNSCKYYPYWNMKGFSFHYSGYYSWSSSVSSRMCFAKKEDLIYAVETFKDEYNDYFLGER